MTPDEIVSEANERGLQLVRFLYCDNGGVIRGKSTHVGQLARRMESGIGLVKGMQSFTSLDTLAPDATYGPVGEIRLVPDPDTFVVLPYAPRSGQMLVNMVELDHSPWALDPRAFLQRMVAEAAEAGLTVELSHPELGWGQQELSIRHAPALWAADNQITYRQTVRAVAGEHGLIASLAPKPFADQAGSGAHLHWSIWDTDHTTNELADGGGEDGLSPLARNAIAGVLAHLPGLLGLTTPSTNSFRRLQPHYWSSAYTAWGIENREAAVRVPSRYWDDEDGSTNLELKASDNTANPYIALGGVMAAV